MSWGGSLLRRIRIPHVFVLLTSIIFFCSLLTFLIPSGQYQREVRLIQGRERTVVVPGTYRTIPKHLSLKALVLEDRREGYASPVGLWGFLSAIPRGMEEAADIIFFIFVIGGVFGILQASGVIQAAIQKLLHTFRGSPTRLTVILMFVIGVLGSTLGMGEELIPLVPLFLIISRELGYDRFYGLSLVMLSADVGFAAATTNPFTVSVAQGIAELPLNSGIGFRVVFFLLAISLAILYVLRYGRRIKKDPGARIMPDDHFHLEVTLDDAVAFNRRHGFILFLCASIFAFVLYAVQTMDWWMAEMGGGFLLMGMLTAAFSRMSLDETTRAFVKGMEEMVVAALVVGFARGIQVVLQQGQILDTVIFSAATLLQHMHRIAAAEGMLVFQTILNFFIPSGSGQAAVTMPLMAPLADVLQLTRQTAVFAFTCGDGFSNSIIPTSGVLMAMLGLAEIPYEKWLRFVWPLFLQLMALSALFLAIAVLINYR